jgi:hypothetical protein
VEKWRERIHEFLHNLDDDELLPSRPGSFIPRGINCGHPVIGTIRLGKTSHAFFNKETTVGPGRRWVGIYGTAGATLSTCRLLPNSSLNFRYRLLF